MQLCNNLQQSSHFTGPLQLSPNKLKQNFYVIANSSLRNKGYLHDSWITSYPLSILDKIRTPFFNSLSNKYIYRLNINNL